MQAWRNPPNSLPDSNETASEKVGTVQYFVALIRMFDQAVVAVMALDHGEQQSMLKRLNVVRSITEVAGWGVKDTLDEIWADHMLSD